MPDAWANSGVDLHLELDGGHGVRDSIERGLRTAVRCGRLTPGATLPPTRALAADLGVARNTVAAAYSQLVAEGWLVARRGSGTRVADRVPDERGVAPAEPGPRDAPHYDLRAGFPDLASFPRTEWAAAARAALATAPAAGFGTAAPAGETGLRVAMAGYLGRARGVQADPARTVVTAGFTSALGTIASVLRASGVRSVGVEAFGHARHRAVLSAAGLNLVPLPVDGAGAVPEGLERVGAVLITSAHQFPLGATLSARRRAEFTAWATRTGGLVIEDDYDGEFRYDRRAPGAMQALAPDHVLYAGTAGKTLAPGVRLGWLVLPAHLVEPAVAEQDATQAQASALAQLTMARFVDSGRYDRHVRRMRLIYRRRRDRLLAVLDGLGLDALGTSAGLHATVPLPSSARQDAIVRRAVELDLAVDVLPSFAAVDGPTPGLVVGYGTPPAHLYSDALARLEKALA